MSQRTGLSSLSRTANSYWLSVLNMVVYIFPCYSLHSSHLLLPPSPMSTSLSSMSVFPLLPAGRFINTIFLYSVLLLFSLSVMSNSLWPLSHVQFFVQHARLPCPSPSPSSVQFSSVAQLCSTVCNSMDRSTPGLPVHHQLPVCSNSCPFELVMLSNHLILCLNPFSSHLQSFSASGSFPVSQFFPSVGQKYWSFSFSISPSNE